jgi:hypothetical protein
MLTDNQIRKLREIAALTGRTTVVDDTYMALGEWGVFWDCAKPADPIVAEHRARERCAAAWEQLDDDVILKAHMSPESFARLTARELQAIPIIPLSYATPIDTGPITPVSDAVFATARETVKRLEPERDARDLIHIGSDWSPAQMARAS